MSAIEYALFDNLNKLERFSRLQMLQLGVPLVIIRQLIARGMVTRVAHPTKKQYRVSDGIIQ